MQGIQRAVVMGELALVCSLIGGAGSYSISNIIYDIVYFMREQVPTVEREKPRTNERT